MVAAPLQQVHKGVPMKIGNPVSLTIDWPNIVTVSLISITVYARR